MSLIELLDIDDLIAYCHADSVLFLLSIGFSI